MLARDHRHTEAEGDTRFPVVSERQMTIDRLGKLDWRNKRWLGRSRHGVQLCSVAFVTCRYGRIVIRLIGRIGCQCSRPNLIWRVTSPKGAHLPLITDEAVLIADDHADRPRAADILQPDMQR